MNTEEKLKLIREYVDLQAEDELLWSIPINKSGTIQEIALQAALRFLHAIIESDSEADIKKITAAYKKYLAEF